MPRGAASKPMIRTAVKFGIFVVVCLAFTL